MASGWNLWVWLPCIGVVSGCCCKEVYRYFPTPLVLALFWQQHPYFFVHFFFLIRSFIIKHCILSCKICILY